MKLVDQTMKLVDQRLPLVLGSIGVLLGSIWLSLPVAFVVGAAVSGVVELITRGIPHPGATDDYWFLPWRETPPEYRMKEPTEVSQLREKYVEDEIDEKELEKQVEKQLEK
ncbi:MAG: hypothetical protein J07HX5_00463 [halophilic archaeon J07HX5]|jgi:hypothetical protein|nr:MAG: hypothetical protein J07HX5_00463 [halophilic archaeon J07HX5]